MPFARLGVIPQARSKSGTAYLARTVGALGVNLSQPGHGISKVWNAPESRFNNSGFLAGLALARKPDAVMPWRIPRNVVVGAVWSSQDLVETLPARFVGRFELLRTQPPEVAVASCSIVEGIDVVSHLGGRQVSVFVDLLLDSLLLEAAKKDRRRRCPSNCPSGSYLVRDDSNDRSDATRRCRIVGWVFTLPRRPTTSCGCVDCWKRPHERPEARNSTQRSNRTIQSFASPKRR